MSHTERLKMDFEQWSTLASEDPAGFERRRREMIDELIGAASQRCRQRLRGLQWRIDQVRDHSPNPMAACISLSNMMWESFAGEEGLADTLNRQHLTGKGEKHQAEESEGADIIPFRPRGE